MKKVIITGASRGIGKAIATSLAKTGNYQLAVCSKTANRADALAAKLKEQHSNLKIFPGLCDVSKKEEVENFVKKLIDEDFYPDVLINNAGIFRQENFFDLSENSLNEIMQTNLYGAYYFSKEIVPLMKQKNSGQVINICSTASIQAYKDAAAYCVSKHALLGLTRVLREELKDNGIAVTAVMPGATLTDSWGKTELPSDRFMSAEDIGESVRSIIELSPQSVAEEIVLRPAKGDI